MKPCRKQLASVGCAFILASGLSACSTLPKLPPVERVNVERVVDAVQCELFQAADLTEGRSIDLKQWHGEFVLTMRVEREAGGSGSVDFVVLSGASAFTPGLSGGLKASTTRQVTLNFDVPGDKVGRKHCERLKKYAAEDGLHGSLGIQEWLSRAVSSLDNEDAAQATGFGHYVEFLVEGQGEGRLRFIVLDASGSGILGGRASDKNTLNVAFARKAPAKTEVVTVEDKATGEKRTVRRSVPGGDLDARSRTREIIQNQFLQNLRVRE